LLEPELDYT